MKKTSKNKKPLAQQISGQALVEYVLMLLVAVSLVAIMTTAFRKTVIHLWGFYIQQISAACPGCPVNPKYRMN